MSPYSRVGFVRVETFIAAPIEACFDAARDIDLHVRTTGKSRERAVAGVTSGLIGNGEEVTFEANHLGMRRRLTSRIVEFDPPKRFVDEMVSGPFKSMRHVHSFESMQGGTLMVDELCFVAPFGPIGWLVDRLFLTGYMRRFLHSRCDGLKDELEHF